MGQRARNKKLFAEIESAYDTAATVAADDAVKSSGLGWASRYGGNRVSQAYDRPGMGNDRQINVNPYGALSEFMVPMIGSGDKDVAPAWGKLLRACAAAQTDDTTAADSGTAEAGTGTTLQDTDKSWTADAFIGMIVEITGGTGAGQIRQIADNDTDTLTVSAAWDTNPDATSEYEIANGEWYYTPVDTGFESLTCIITEELVQQTLTGVRGNFGIRANPGDLPWFVFNNWMGSYNRMIAKALTSPDDSAYADAVPVTTSNTTIFTVGGVAHPISGFTFDAGVQLERRADPNRRECIVTDRTPSGTVILSPADASGIIALLASVENHSGITDVPIAFKHGSGVGSIVELSIPAANFSDIQDQEVAGETYFSLPFSVLTPNSGDAWRITQGSSLLSA